MRLLYDFKKLIVTTGCGLQFGVLLTLRSPFDAAMTVAQAVFLQNAFNAIAQNDGVRLNYVCAAFGCATLCLFLYNGTIWSIYAPFVVRMEKKIRIMLAERISAFSCEKIESVTHGEWLTLLNTDVQLPFSQPLHFPHAVNAIIRIIVSSAILWHMNPVIFDYVMLFVIPHILMSQFFVARVMPKLNKKSLEATAVNTDNLDALITCADIAALYDSRAFLIEKFKRGSLDLLKAKMKMRGKNALNEAIIPLFGMGGYLTVLLAGSSWIAGGRLTFGDLTAAFQYRGGVLIGSMMLINSLVSIQASVAGVKRINAVMDDPA